MDKGVYKFDNSVYYDVEHIAKLFNVTKQTVWIWLRSGKLKAVAVGKKYLISEKDLKEFEQQLKAKKVLK